MVLYKPRRNSLRLPNYDYSLSGCYYITINTHGKKYIFNRKDYCQIAEKHIVRTEQKFNLIMENSVVMATHVHLLFTLMPDIDEAKLLPLRGGSKSRPYGEADGGARSTSRAEMGGNKSRPYEDGDGVTHPARRGEFYTRPLKISVSKIIASLKAGIWHDLRQRGFFGKLWQRGYYDHIIRHEEDLTTHWYYIERNKYQKGEEVNL